MSSEPNISIEAVEAALHTILKSSDYDASCPVKTIRKRLEKMLKLPKKALKGADADIVSLIKVITEQNSIAAAISNAVPAALSGPAPTAATAPPATSEPAAPETARKKRRQRVQSAATVADVSAVVNAVSIRTAVLELLEKADLEDLTLRKVMTHLSDVFKVDFDSLSNYKDEIKTIIVDYKDGRQMQELPKTFRFSKAEDAIILRAIEQYKLAYNYTDEDISPALRATPEGAVRTRQAHESLWSGIGAVLPHRTRKNIWSRAQRLLLGKVGKWSPELIQDIRDMVQRDFSWVDIGKSVGLHREDCRGAFMRSEGRTRSGRFSPEEDQQLYDAVKKVCAFEDDQNLPLMNIPWKEVADQMDNLRLNTDYCKRWRIVRHKVMQAAAGDNGKHHTDLREIEDCVLQYIQECGAEDPSEVTWTAIDRKFNLPLGSAGMRWTSMFKSVPPGTSFTDAVSILQSRRAAGRPAILATKRRRKSQKETGSEENDSSRKRRLSIDEGEGESDASQHDSDAENRSRSGSQGAAPEPDTAADNVTKRKKKKRESAAGSGEEDSGAAAGESSFAQPEKRSKKKKSKKDKKKHEEAAGPVLDEVSATAYL